VGDGITMNKSPFNLDQFEKWRTLVEVAIQQFMSRLPSQVSEKLDYSRESLEVLGDWFLTTYPPYETIEDPAKVIVSDGLMYYLGETYRKNLGGYWNMHFAEVEPDYRYGEWPVIEGFPENDALCPWYIIFKMGELRDKSLFSNVLGGVLQIRKHMEGRPPRKVM
jgi:hypothetical protein